MRPTTYKVALSLTLALALNARADVTLNGIFSNQMVLQRDVLVPVWGTASPGENVTVTIAGRQKSTRADKEGKWMVKLDPMAASDKPRQIKVTGTSAQQARTITDVLIGDVWLCSGQSNMAYTMGALKTAPQYASDLTDAKFPLIRQAFVARTPSLTPAASAEVKWTTCAPSTVAEFTAAGFYFARELQKKVNVPIGLVNSSWGGTSARSWTSKEALDTVPELKKTADEQIANLAQLPDQIAKFPEAIAAWETKYGRTNPANTGEQQGWAAPEADTKDWKPMQLRTKWRDAGLPNGGVVWIRKEVDVPAASAGKGFRLDLGMVDEQYTTAYFNGEKLGDSGTNPPQFYGGYVNYDVPPQSVKAGKNVVAIRFVTATGEKIGITRSGAMMGFSAIGVTGVKDDCLVRVESEFSKLTKEALAERPRCPKGDAAHTASTLFGGMIHPLIPFPIRGVLWYQGEQDASIASTYRTLLPLMIRDWRARWGQGDFPFIIQQLPNWSADGSEKTTWAKLREAQALTAKTVPNCMLSVGIDIGEANDVHPKNKREIGRRLALVALNSVYGKKVESSGPVYDSMTVDGPALRVKFSTQTDLKSLDGTPLKGFTIAGKDKKFVPAEATISGRSVKVSSPQVAKPVAVRYAFINNPEGLNLSNASGLPAMPFRTDDWE